MRQEYNLLPRGGDMKKKACMVLCVIIILLLNACGKNVKKNNIETEILSQLEAGSFSCPDKMT